MFRECGAVLVRIRFVQRKAQFYFVPQLLLWAIFSNNQFGKPKTGSVDCFRAPKISLPGPELYIYIYLNAFSIMCKVEEINSV